MTNSNGQHNACPLPVGWTACSLADAVTPGRPRGNPADFVGQPFIGLEHIEAHTTRMLGFVPAETMRSSGVQFSAGDVLYGRMRPYLNKVWLADRDGICSGEFIVFPKTGALSGAFLKYRLNAQDFVTFTDHATTGDRPRADFADFGKFPVLVPPLAEQTRIADRIDELFTDLAAGVAALERVKRNLSRYRAAVLHAAVTGRLTEAWRRQHGKPEEPGTKLLERILAERRRQWENRTLARYEKAGKPPPKNWRDRYPEPSPPKPPADGSPFPELPEGWCWASVDQLVVEGLCNGISVKGTDAPPGVAALKLNAMSDRGFDYSAIRYIPIDDATAEDNQVHEGDFFVSRGNGSLHLLARGTVAQAPPVRVVFPDTMIRLRLCNGATWLPSMWPSRLVRAQIERMAKTTAGIYKVSQGDLAALAIPLPPLAEQSAIVEAVSEKLSQIDGLEAEIERGLARAARLRQAILKAAFEGKLVPQDPSDEPASVLLERIARAWTAPSGAPGSDADRPRPPRSRTRAPRKKGVKA